MITIAGVVVTLVILLLIVKARSRPPSKPKPTLSLYRIDPIKIKPQQQIIPASKPTTKKKKRKTKKSSLSESTSDLLEMTEVPEELQVESQPDEKLPSYDSKISHKNSALEGIQLQDHFRYEFILEELQMIRNYFPREVRELIPHSQRIMGTYEIELFDCFEADYDRKEIKLRWVYTMDYPKQPAVIKLQDTTMPKHLQIQVISIVSESSNNSHQQVYIIYQLLVKLYELLLDSNSSLFPNPNNQPQPSPIAEPLPTPYQPPPNQTLLIQSALNHSKRKDQFDEFMDVMINPYLPGDVRDRPQFDNSLSKVLVERQHQPEEYEGRSRYKSEFDEIQKLGEGGFGAVFLARNHLDKNLNAVKKVRLNMADMNSRKVKLQVTFLSKLNHPNIVRYYQSWIEKVDNIDQLCSELGIEDSEQIDDIKAEYDRFGKSEDILFCDENDESEQQEQQADLQISAIEQNDPFCYRQKSHKSLLQQGYSSQNVKFQSSNHQKSRSRQNNRKFPFQILYIAMQYCSGQTLKQFIRNELQIAGTDDKVDQRKTKIVRGILEALVYLHDKKIIHRDLKPANIFFDKKKQKIKLGDFGLATTMEESLFEKGTIGTPLYRAPEGYVGTSKYAEKVDIYSLGIILFELYYNKNYKTQQQRIQVMKALSVGQMLPPDFQQYCKNPQIRHQIKQMISKDPSKRPSARQILSRVNNRLFGQLVSAITNPTHFQFNSLLSSLFQIRSLSPQPFLREPFRRYNYTQLEQIFRCHGGTNIHVSPLMPVQDYQTLNRKRLAVLRNNKMLTLSREGYVLEMSGSSYLPWLRCLREYLNKNLRNRPKNIRRYSFGEVVREQNDGEQQGFREGMLGVFDLVDTSKEDLLENTCEMIKMSLQISELSYPNCMLHLSHSMFVRVLAEEFSINEQTLSRILLSKQFQKNIQLDADSWQQGFKNYDIQTTHSRRLYKLFKLSSEDPSIFMQQLLKQMPNRKATLQLILEHLLNIKRMLSYMKLQPHIITYRLLPPPQSTCGAFWRITKQDLPAIHLSGFTTTEQYYRQEDMNLVHVEFELTPLPKPPIEVYVWTLGDDMLDKEMIEIVAEMWDHGVAADWSKVSLGEKVEGVRVGLILKRAMKKVSVGVRRFEKGGGVGKVEWYPREGFTVDMVKNILQDK